jgi:hypothetical protein
MFWLFHKNESHSTACLLKGRPQNNLPGILGSLQKKYKHYFKGMQVWRIERLNN